MMRSTLLYTCNHTGMHDVSYAAKFGVVAYDWSNAKSVWANQHPMNCEEVLTKQAEMVLAADPGIPGEQPRVWVYRNTIKALNWFSSVREKLDDPQYAGWFVKFKDYKGPQSNNSYHVPACDWYNNGTDPRCSGFYHDQEQTPNHPGGGKPYPASVKSGICDGQCDCGPVNPCGEYIFDHRIASFADWFINSYMLSSETLGHKPQPISLGWLDDSMSVRGPSEENPNFIADTGSTPQDMQDHVAAYTANMARLTDAVVGAGGFYMQLTQRGPQIRPIAADCYNDCGNVTPKQCAATLREDWCVAEPPAWKNAATYLMRPVQSSTNTNMTHGDEDGSGSIRVNPVSATQAAAQFLLTRGPYAWIGYFDWQTQGGISNWPRPPEWDTDYGAPDGPCSETGEGTGIFTRRWSKATVTWDCNEAKGTIVVKSGL